MRREPVSPSALDETLGDEHPLGKYVELSLPLRVAPSAGEALRSWGET
jgi:hypothetical protein